VSAKAVRKLYDPQFFAGMPERDKREQFQFWASDHASQTVKAIDAQHPGTYNHYRQWTENAASLLFGSTFANMSSYPGSKSSVFDWGFANGQIELSLKSGLPKERYKGEHVAREMGTVRQVQDVNAVLARMRSVYEAGGQDPDASLLQFMQTMRLNVNAPAQAAPIDAFMEMLSKAAPEGGPDAEKSKKNPVKDKGAGLRPESITPAALVNWGAEPLLDPFRTKDKDKDQSRLNP
jgi:hypothetical protein